MRMLAVLSMLVLGACGQSQDTMRVFTLGDTTIRLVAHRGGPGGVLYYNMHDDEHTSVDATLAILDDFGGTLYELVHTGERNISFHVDTTRYEIDPNRIYTDAGIWREIRLWHVRDSVFRMQLLVRVIDSLIEQRLLPELPLFHHLRPDTTGARPVPDSLLRPGLYELEKRDRVKWVDTLPPYPFTQTDSVAFRMVRAFSDSLLTFLQIDSQELVVALHNNRNHGYSMASYKLDSVYQDEALAIYIGMHPDPDDFYFVTDRRIFEALQPNQFHIVLQDNARMTDDGSLSVYCGQRGIPYVNVEAQHRHLEEQKRMIRILLQRLGFNPK